MADLPVARQRNYLALPSKRVERLWLEQQIAEKKARCQRLKADAYEIMYGRLKSIEAETIMVEREIMVLENQLDEFDRQVNTNDAIDVKGGLNE